MMDLLAIEPHNIAAGVLIALCEPIGHYIAKRRRAAMFEALARMDAWRAEQDGLVRWAERRVRDGLPAAQVQALVEANRRAMENAHPAQTSARFGLNAVLRNVAPFGGE